MPSRKAAAIHTLSGNVINSGVYEFQLLDILGAGAYGTIYRAVDRTVVSRVPSYLAVKVLPFADQRSCQHVYQAREVKFHKELCATGHPNILKLHRVVHDSRYIYIVLDYCAGGDMFNVISRTRHFSRNDTLIKNLFLQLIDAVYACHQTGIFHRDLKPENILISPDCSHLYLSDFGLATRSTESSNRTGTGYYMSPECIDVGRSTKSYKPCCGDVWALGVILTNMITGRCPWKYAMKSDECFSQYLRDRTFLQKMLPISGSARDILYRIFTPEPEDRIDIISLRRLIEEVDTFYMSPEELAQATIHVRSAWREYQPPRLKQIMRATLLSDSDESTMESVSSESTMYDSLEDDSDDSNEHSNGIGSEELLDMEEGFALYNKSDSSSSELSDVPVQPFVPVAGAFTLGSAGKSGSSSYYSSANDSLRPKQSQASTSGSDSDGPVTPETYAQDPEVAVPDLSDGMRDAIQPIKDLLEKQPSLQGIETPRPLLITVGDS